MAVVRDGRTTQLTLVLSASSVARQREEVVARVRAAPPRTPPAGTAAAAPPRGAGRSAPPEPTSAAWALALGGLAGVAVIARALRSQRRP